MPYLLFIYEHFKVSRYKRGLAWRLPPGVGERSEQGVEPLFISKKIIIYIETTLLNAMFTGGENTHPSPQHP